MKVKAIKAFTDLEANTDRVVGDVWEITQARKDALDGSQYAPLVEVVQTATKTTKTPTEGAKTAKKTTTRKRTTKKAE